MHPHVGTRRICSPSVAAGLLLSLAVAAGFTARPARADEPGPNANGITHPSIATSLPHDGDPFGHRRSLAERGVTYSLIYTNDILANLHGGLKRGTVDQGKLEAAVTVDLEKAAHLKNLTFFANFFEIHDTGRIRRDYVSGINTIAAIEARPTQRLSELWLERKFTEAKSSLRIGQLAADVEFFYSSASILFLQSDWATISAANLPSGGPAYPLSTPGVRYKYDPNPNTTFLVAVFNGDPAGPGNGDEQIRNRHGLNFRVKDPALVLAEAQYRRNQEKTDAGLASTLKLGAWGHFGWFDDKRLANDGTLLADPAGNGDPFRRKGNAGIYAIADQQIYRPKGGEADSGVTIYGRISGSPSDRNLINFYVDGGIVFAGMIPHRPDDKLGAGFIYARYSDRVRDADRDLQVLAGSTAPIRDFEANLELTYSAQIVPGWTVQPVATYVWHPSGGVVPDAFVAGARTIVRY